MESRTPADLARALYAALAAGNREQLNRYFIRNSRRHRRGHAVRHRRRSCRTRGDATEWLGRDRPAFEARAEPERFLDLADGRLLVTGRYRGHGEPGRAALDAAFAHLIAVDQGRIKSFEQFTDTARWHDAAGPLRTVLLDFEGGVATLRLNRPDKGNAIDEAMAADLARLQRRLRKGQTSAPF